MISKDVMTLFILTWFSGVSVASQKLFSNSSLRIYLQSGLTLPKLIKS